MTGYRPDDDWAITKESGERVAPGWKVIVASLPILVAAIMIEESAHIPAWLFMGTVFAVASALVWLLIYCLRMGVVGSRWGGDVHRESQPIAYWIGIATLALAASFSIYLVWFLVT